MSRLTDLKDMLSEVKRSPSQLVFGETTSAQMRDRLLQSAVSLPLIEEIRKDAELLLAEDIPGLTFASFRLYADTGNRSEYERIYFRRRKRLTTFGLMAWLEPQHEGYANALQEAIWAILDEYTWCLPAHILHGPEMAVADSEASLWPVSDSRLTVDLFSAETAFALSEIAALHGEALPPLLRGRIREETLRRVLRPFVTQPPFDWETATHNWASVCGGSIACAAIYLLQGEDELAAVLERALPALESYLRGFEDDGACTEGYMYWQYGFGYFAYAADLIKRRTGGAADLFAQEKVRQIALFQQKCFMAGRRIVNFSDASSEAGIFMGLSAYLRSLYPEMEMPEAALRAGFSDDHCHRWAPAWRNLLWLSEDGEQGAGWKTATYCLPDAQWLVSRQVRAEGSYVFAAKGGHNDEPHNHNDIGQFILYAGGESLLTDLGSGQYTRDYFGDGRYDILCNGSQGHSVPIINGGYQRVGGTARAQLIAYSQTDEQDMFHIEFASAYEVETLDSLQRQFVWGKVGRPSLELIDTFQFKESPSAICERMMSWFRPECAEDGRIRIQGSKSGDQLYIAYDQEMVDWDFESLVHHDHYGKHVPCFAIHFTVKQGALRKELALSFTFSFE
ncbi:heparinase II/III family protein [Paenibacillus sp. SI8]|uniref:heparinase II/III family protein n=1 Tax=unclassified Paenibacillus TaxID=185978 RepID=UPI0034673CEA